MPGSPSDCCFGGNGQNQCRSRVNTARRMANEPHGGIPAAAIWDDLEKALERNRVSLWNSEGKLIATQFSGVPRKASAESGGLDHASSVGRAAAIASSESHPYNAMSSLLSEWSRGRMDGPLSTARYPHRFPRAYKEVIAHS